MIGAVLWLSARWPAALGMFFAAGFALGGVRC